MELTWQVSSRFPSHSVADLLGIVGMESVPGSFDIVGVAPEASLYIYRALDCKGHGGSDSILAAMLKAQQDGVHLVSMSLGIGSQSFNGAVDPLAIVTKQLTDAGIAVIGKNSLSIISTVPHTNYLIVANSNSGVGSKYANELYTAGWPATNPTAIGVGSIANSNFPLVYSATDSFGNKLDYASIYPLNFTDGVDILILDSGCSTENWESALVAIENINKTIIAFQADSNCKATGAGNWNGSPIKPVIILAFNANSSNPYDLEYSSPSPGFYGTVQIINLNAVNGAIFARNYESAGGYKK